MPTLHWVGKDKVVNHHHDVPFKLLDKQYTFNANEGITVNSSGNKIIQGDNLEVLKSLLPEFEGKINCIYIDPPYNTGNEGWVYNDNVNDPRIKKWLGQVVGKEGEDLSRHDKWLCMMYPRLKLLHRLLADDGVIFVSIDDNEQAHLKILMDEIFGTKNCIGPIIHNKLNSKNDTLNIQKNHEFILAYGKIGDSEKTMLLSKKNSLEKKIYTEAGRYFYVNDPITTRGEGGILNARCNLGYTVYFNAETKDKLAVCDYDLSLAKVSNNEEDVYSTNAELISHGYIPIRPPKVRGKLGAWTWELEKFNSQKDNILISEGKNGKYAVKKRVFVDESDITMKEGNYWYRPAKSENTKSILEFSTSEGTSALTDIMGEAGVFDNPKNIQLIEYLISLIQGENSIILDSFAGSGTTAHAVLNLNAQDGGNRRFILCEMMDYAESITAERVRRVINGYGEGNKSVDGTSGSFDFYTVGVPLFTEDKNLNEEVGVEAIRSYVAYTENIPTENILNIENEISPYALGRTDTALLVFHYEKDKVTTLDLDFLGQLEIKNMATRPEHFVIYADKCALDMDFLYQHSITFKRIPRDITRF